MKARFLALAALVLGLASCQTEPEGLDVNVGGAVDTTITVSIPETTRAADSAEGAFKNLVNSDEYTIRYIFQVFYNGYESGAARQVIYSDGNTVSFPVRLVPGRDYNFVAWADVVPQAGKTLDVLGEYNKESDFRYNTEKLDAVTFKGDWLAMDETFDAYTDAQTIEYYGTTSINLNLTRPFAKLRVMTTDMVELRDLQIVPEGVTVAYTVPVYKTFDVTAQAAKTDGASTHTFTYNLSKVQKYTATETTSTLFTNYLFGAENGVVKFTMDVKDDTSAAELIKSNNFNTDIPVQRNYLTTISGNILTDGNNVKVDIVNNGAFEGEKEWPDENKNSEQLAYAAMFGGEVTLTENITLTQPLTIVEGANAVINLNGKTITGTFVKGEGAIIENNGILTLVGGTIKNTETNGDAVINNNGELVLDGVKIEGAPIGTTNYPNYAVYTSGKLTVENETQIISDRGALNMKNGADVTINGGEFIVTDAVGTRTLTAHVIYAYGSNSKLTINGGNFAMNIANGGGTSVICPAGATIKVYGGNFFHAPTTDVQSGCFQNYMGYGAPVDVYGGVFNDDTVTKSGNLAAGYKAIAAGGLYYVLPEKIADAAETAVVTSVTESTADVATALATNNGEATMFMWNDVAYIAKYGEVVITSIADEATTVRGVVESSTGLKSATVADGIEVVGNRTFRKCANLETVALPNTLTEIGPAVFQSCSKLANITIPESVTTIGEGAFAECTALTSINIPYGVTRIEADALRATGLVSVEFHEGVTYFGAQAFRDCKQLKEVIINAPEFTMEGNTFGIMAAPFTPMTIYVANAEMKAYVESKLTAHAETYITVVAPEAVANAEQLAEALAKGENVVLTQDVTAEAATTAPYGNKYAFKLDGGVIDGNGHELHMECYGDDYGIMTSGGTIKNVTIKEGCRAVMIMYPQSDVILDNVNIGGDGVLYPINTGEGGKEGVNLVVTNSTLAGWTSYGLIESATFTNVEFKQGTYYNNIYGRVLKPYVNTVLTNCSFVEHMNLDLSALRACHKIVMKNCTVNGQAVTAETFTIPTTNAQYDTELFTIDLPSWASSINDCVVFE